MVVVMTLEVSGIVSPFRGSVTLVLEQSTGTRTDVPLHGR